MKYVALLRGINVGGNAIIRMDELKKAVEQCGFAEVSTYIQSGNVIFKTDENDREKITNILEQNLSGTFHIDLKIVVLSHDHLKQILHDVPREWNTSKNLRCYIAFAKSPTTPQEVLPYLRLAQGVDSVQVGNEVIYMTTKMEGLMKSGFKKLISTKIYKRLTMRNYNTSRKLLELMS